MLKFTTALAAVSALALLAGGCAGAPKSSATALRGATRADAPRRVSGDTNIELDARYRAQVRMHASGQLDGAVKLCVAPDGSVDHVRVIRSTGIDDFDRTVVDSVSTWRYEPYAAPTSDTRVCQQVAVVYKQI